MAGGREREPPTSGPPSRPRPEAAGGTLLAKTKRQEDAHADARSRPGTRRRPRGLAALTAQAVAHDTLATTAAQAALTQDPPAPQPPTVDINVRTDRGVWYTQPVWIAIGIVALVLIVALLVMAGRGGGGTTVVRG
jgi:hypothetical protein